MSDITGLGVNELAFVDNKCTELGLPVATLANFGNGTFGKTERDLFVSSTLKDLTSINMDIQARRGVALGAVTPNGQKDLERTFRDLTDVQERFSISWVANAQAYV